jgi:hypothetical protein
LKRAGPPWSAFDINPGGVITRWRYSYDLKRFKDQLSAAGF